jgi:outer membrane protein OmpU
MALSAGVAYAEVSINGAARMGVVSSGGTTTLDKRVQLTFAGSTETTSGLTFGASIRVRSEDGNPDAGKGFNGGRVYMSTNGVEVAVGNIYGAIDSLPGLYQSEAGLVGNGAGDVASIVGFAYDGYSSNGAGSGGVEVMYSAGAMSAHLSYSDATISKNVGAAKRTAAHVAYTAGDWTVALGMQSSSVAAQDLTAVTVSGKIGDIGIGFSAMDADAGRKMTLNGSSSFGATTVSAFVTDDSSAAEAGYGLGLAYDLGGASLVGAVERNTDGSNYADLGVSFSF